MSNMHVWYFAKNILLLPLICYTFTYWINAFGRLLKISRFTFSINWIWRIETPSTAIGCETRWAIVPRLTCDALLCRGFAIFINPWLALAILVIWNISWKHEAFLKKRRIIKQKSLDACLTFMVCLKTFYINELKAFSHMHFKKYHQNSIFCIHCKYPHLQESISFEYNYNSL